MLEKGVQKTYKNSFFEHPLARCKKRKTCKKTKKNKKYTRFGGGLENGQEVVPLVLAQKREFSKSSKKPIFIVFPEKVGGGHFFSKKAYVTRRTLLEGQKMIIVFGNFKDKFLRRPKKGGV